MDLPPTDIGNGVSPETRERAREFGGWMADHPDELQRAFDAAAKEGRKLNRRTRFREVRAKAWRICERVFIVAAGLAGIATIIDFLTRLLAA